MWKSADYDYPRKLETKLIRWMKFMLKTSFQFISCLELSQTLKIIPYGSMATVSEGTANPLVTSHHTQVTLPFRRHGWIHMDLIIPNFNIILIFTKPRKIPDSSPNSPARTSSLPMVALVIRVWSKCKHTSTRLNLSKLHQSQMCQKVTPSHVVVVLEFCLLACM